MSALPPLLSAPPVNCSPFGTGEYIFGNMFVKITPRCKFGVEYLYGTRENMDGLKNHANRANMMVQYNF